MRKWTLPGALFLLALGIRLGYVADVHDSVTFSSPLVDAYTYDLTARSVAENGLSALELPFYQPPLYPLLLAATYSVTDGSWVAPRVIQAILGALTVLLAFFLAARLGGRRAGSLAAGLMAVYGPAIYLEGELLPPALVLPLVMGGLLLLIRADESRRPILPLIAAGVLFGTAGAVRPTLLLVGALATLWWLRGTGGPKARARTALLLVAAVAAPILPFTIANRVGGGETVLVSWNGGINFYLGNGANSDSLTAIQPGHHWYRLQVAPFRAGVFGSRRAESDYWIQRAREEAVADPGAWLAASARKVLRLLDARETPRNTDYEDFRRDSRVLSLPLPGFGIAAPLAFLGLVLAFGPGRAPPRRRWLLVAVLAAVAGENVAFFVAGRYRLEAVPVLCVLAGLGAEQLIRRRASLSIPIWAGLAAVTAVVWVDFLGERAIDETQASIHRATAYRRAGLYAGSERIVRQALQDAPDNFELHTLLGEAAMRDDDYERAVEHFTRTLQRAPDYFRVLLNLARSFEKLGRDAEAAEAWRRAVAADPYATEGRLGWGVFLAVRERWDEAWVQFEAGLRIDPTDPDLLANLANLERIRRGS